MNAPIQFVRCRQFNMRAMHIYTLRRIVYSHRTESHAVTSKRYNSVGNGCYGKFRVCSLEAAYMYSAVESTGTDPGSTQFLMTAVHEVNTFGVYYSQMRGHTQWTGIWHPCSI